MIKKLQSNLLVILALISLVILYFISFTADYIAPYNPLQQNSQAGYAPPSKIHFDSELGLYVFETKCQVNKESYKKDCIELKDKKYPIKFFQANKLISVETPARINVFGTDRVGRDLLSRLIYGSRPSLTIGFISLLIAFPLGIFYGAISGFFGGIIDNLMMRLAEAIMSLPSFYLLIILSAILPAQLNNFQRFALITIILSFISWAGLSRIVRGLVLSFREKEFIESAKSIGQNNFIIVLKHLIPHTSSFLIVAATLSVPGYIIGETALSFLGLGINQPDPSWGNILAEGKDLSNILTRPWLLWVPAMLIFTTIFSFNIIGDFLRDYYDPKTN